MADVIPVKKVPGGLAEFGAADKVPAENLPATEWSAQTVAQAEAEDGTATTRRAWTAQRVRQAIVAWWNGVSSAWGRSFVSSASAAAGRTALELGNAATATVQSSATDSTANSLMSVGAFGLGGSASAASTNSLAISGVAGIYDADGAASLPSGVTVAALIRAPKAGTADHRLLIARGAGPVVSAWISSASVGVNTPWDKLFSSYGVNAVVIDTGSIGYGTGSGGTVTQVTDKTAGVTLNKPSGRITTSATTLAAGASATFLVTNNKVAVNDCVIVSVDSTNTLGVNYRVETVHVAVGGFRIRVTNISAGNLSEALAINFSVIKGAVA